MRRGESVVVLPVSVSVVLPLNGPIEELLSWAFVFATVLTTLAGWSNLDSDRFGLGIIGRVEAGCAGLNAVGWEVRTRRVSFAYLSFLASLIILLVLRHLLHAGPPSGCSQQTLTVQERGS